LRRHNYRQTGRHQRLDEASTGRRLTRLLRRLTVVAAVAGIGLVAYLVYQSPLMQIREVSVVGVESLDPAMIAATSGLKGQTLLQAETDSARNRILALPGVRDVSISRHWPGRIVIAVQERHAWGYWQINDQTYVIDDQGVVLDDARPDEGAPVIYELDTQRRLATGDQVDSDAITLSQELMDKSPTALRESVSRLEFSQHSGLTVTFDSGLRATFGDSRDFDYKLSVLYVLLEKSQEDAFAVRSVDLRFGDNVSFQ
jgi:cell division protein FtsQ